MCRILLAVSLTLAVSSPGWADPAIVVNGTVRAPDGAGLRGVRVELVRQPTNFEWQESVLAGRGRQEPVAAALSDASGRFSLEAPGAGVWRILVTAPGFVPMRFFPLPLAGSTELPPLTLARHDDLRIEVRNASKEGVAGLWVYAAAADPASWSGLATHGWRVGARWGRSDEHGRIVFPRLPGERLEIHVFEPGLAHGSRFIVQRSSTLTFEPKGTRRRLEVRSSEGTPLAGLVVAARELFWPVATTDPEGSAELLGTWSKPVSLHLFAPDGRQQAVVVEPPGTRESASKPVVFADPRRVTGSVVDAESRRPLAGAVVWPGADPGRGRLTGPEGTFELVAPPGERYWVQAHAAGYLPRQQWIEHDGNRVRTASLALVAAATAAGRVVDPSGAPLAGVELESSRLESTRKPRFFHPDPLDSRAVSDRRGGFTLRRLEPRRRYLLTAKKAGFATRRLPLTRLEDLGDPVDLGTLVLVPEAALEGTVTTADGEPIDEVSVRLVRPRRGSAELRERRVRSREPATVTGADGRFRVGSLEPGLRHDLIFTRSGYQSASIRGVEAPSPEPLAIVLEPSSQVRGRVVDRQGAPIAEATVSLRGQPPQAGRLEVDRYRAEDSRSAVTDGSGEFLIEEVVPGAVELDAVARGFQPSDPIALEITAGERVEDLELVLERGSVLEGRVTNSRGEGVAEARISLARASAGSDAEGFYRLEGIAPGRGSVRVRHRGYDDLIRELEIEPGYHRADFVLDGGWPVAGRVLDEAGAPVAGAEVMALLEERRQRRRYTAESDADGRFRFPSVTRGTYDVTAHAPGFAATEIDGGFEVSGGAVEGLEIRLRRGTSLVGRILGLDFEDLAAVQVRAEGRGRPRAGRIDHEGRYEIVDLGPGDWLVQAWLRGGSRQVEARVAIAPGDRELRRDLEFGRGFKLTGRVLYGERPVAGASVSARGYESAIRRSVSSDYQGAFELEDLEPGRYRINVSSRRELLLYNRDLDVDQDLEVVIEISTARLSGTVRSAESGEPVEAALVLIQKLLREEGASPGSLVTLGTDANGSFSVARLSAGAYRLRVQKDGFEPLEEELEIDPGDDLGHLDLVLTPTRGLELVVRLASGNRLNGVRLSVLDADGRSVHFDSRLLDADGRTRFPSVPAGTWDLLVGAPQAATQRLSAVTVPGAPVELVLADASRLRIRVPELVESNQVGSLTILDSQGQIFEDLGFDGALNREWPLSGGAGILEGIPPGIWTLRAVAPDGRRWEGTIVTAGGQSLELSLE